MFYTKTTNLWYYNIHDTENSYDTYKQTNKQTNKCFIVNQDAHNEQYNQEKKITVYNWFT